MDIPDENRIAAGINPVVQLLKSGTPVDRLYVAKGKDSPQIRSLICLAKEKGIPVITTNSDKLDSICEGVQHQGIAAVCAAKEYSTVDEILAFAKEKNENPFIIILDEIKDPHNFGAIIRTADGCGAHGIIVAKRNSAPLSQVVSKTSAGAIESVRIARVSNIAATIDSLKNSGLWVFGTSDSAQFDYLTADFKVPCAVVIGDEGSGIGRLIKEKCDFLIKIPMYGSIGSLNASVAAGIILYEVVRQRRD